MHPSLSSKPLAHRESIHEFWGRHIFRPSGTGTRSLERAERDLQRSSRRSLRRAALPSCRGIRRQSGSADGAHPPQSRGPKSLPAHLRSCSWLAHRQNSSALDTPSRTGTRQQGLIRRPASIAENATPTAHVRLYHREVTPTLPERAQIIVSAMPAFPILSKGALGPPCMSTSACDANPLGICPEMMVTAEVLLGKVSLVERLDSRDDQEVSTDLTVVINWSHENLPPRWRSRPIRC